VGTSVYGTQGEAGEIIPNEASFCKSSVFG